MRFNFPDVADFPENLEPVCDEARLKVPAFYHRPHFGMDLEHLTNSILRLLSDVEGAAPIVAAHKARIQTAAKAYFTLPRVQGSGFTGSGVMACKADTEHLRNYFKKDIEEVRGIDAADRGIKDVDRVKVRKDEAACAFVQGFLNYLGFMREACCYRQTVSVRQVAIQVSRPDDRHHYQQFGDCSTTTRLLNLHMDPKPGLLKAIIYLGDVGPDNGPFQCVPRSNRWDVDKIQRIFAWGNSVANYLHTPLHRRVANAFPARFRRNAIVGRLIPDDSELGAFLWKNLVTYPSDFATVMMFDPTFTLHRGGLCNKGERVNLQVVLK